jgi:DNA repair protein RadC
MAIINWPKEERPREKLLAHGPKHLSDAELLAIFLRTGVKGQTALDIARELLSEFNGLKNLINAPLNVLSNKHGIGKAKYAILQAAIEMGHRHRHDSIKIGTLLKNTETAKTFFADRLKHHTREVFACLFLNTQNHTLAFQELFFGGLSESSIYPREIVKHAMLHNAAKIIIGHNHPSGDPTPSPADCELTVFLKNALAMVDISLVDHIVVGHEKCVSLVEAGHI